MTYASDVCVWPVNAFFLFTHLRDIFIPQPEHLCVVQRTFYIPWSWKPYKCVSFFYVDRDSVKSFFFFVYASSDANCSCEIGCLRLYCIGNTQIRARIWTDYMCDESEIENVQSPIVHASIVYEKFNEFLFASHRQFQFITEFTPLFFVVGIFRSYESTCMPYTEHFWIQ